MDDPLGSPPDPDQGSGKRPRPGTPWLGVLAVLFAAFVGWSESDLLGWALLALGGYTVWHAYQGEARHESLQRQISALRRELAALPKAEPFVEPPFAAPPAAEAVWPVVPAPDAQEPRAEADAPVVVAMPPAAAAPLWPDLPVAPPPLPPPAPALPHTPPPPPFDWDGAWRTLAGPLAGIASGRSQGMASAEAHIGTVWFSRIGAVLLIIGAIFAYRYGVTNDTLKVAIGYAAALSLLGLGYWGYRRTYLVWAQAVTGAGLGLLYLTTTAAATLFATPVLSLPVAFALMILTTVIGTALAVFYDSIVVGLLGMMGGFATPFLLSAGAGDFRTLFGYIVVLDAGLLLVAYYKRWALYNYLILAATWGIYGLWYGDPFRPGDNAWGFAFASAFFAIFSGVSITYNIVHRQKSWWPDLSLVLINGFTYFSLGLALISGDQVWLRGAFALAMAAVHGGLGYLTLRRNPVDRVLILNFFGLAGIFLTIAFPVALSGPWITVAWALEGAALVWVGFRTGAPEGRYGGLLVLVLSAVRLAVLEAAPITLDLGSPGAPVPAGWMRAFVFIIPVAAYYLAAWAYDRYRDSLGVLSTLAVTANLFTLWYITLELILHYRRLGGSPEVAHRELAIAAAWGLYGLAVSLADMRLQRSGVRQGARLILGTALAILIVAGVGPGAEAARWMRHLAALAVIGGIWAAEWTVRQRGLDSNQNGWLALAANVVAFGAVALETNRLLAPWRASIQAFAALSAWAAYALAATGVGIWLRSAGARLLAAGFWHLIIIAAAAYGATNLAATPGLRLLAFILIVPGAYLATALVLRAAIGRRELEVEAFTYAALAAALLTAWWGSAEISAYLGATATATGGPALSSTRAFAVITWLAAYALAVGRAGVRLRSLQVRLLAASLQAVSLVGLAVALFDLAAAWPLRALAVTVVVGATYAGHTLLASPDVTAEERDGRIFLSLVACVLTIGWIGTEIDHGLEVSTALPAARLVLESQRNHWILLAVSLYGLVVTGVGLRLRSLPARVLGIAISVLAAAGILTVGLANLAASGGLRLAAFAGVAGGLYATSALLRYFAQRSTVAERQWTEWIALGVAALTMVWLTYQALQYFAAAVAAARGDEAQRVWSTLNFTVSALWGAYGFAVLVAGFSIRHRNTRLLGLAMLILTLGKIGVRDMWQLEVTWRIWITLGLGITFVVASLMYQRFARVILGNDAANMH